jgi:hypothetical protein
MCSTHPSFVAKAWLHFLHASLLLFFISGCGSDPILSSESRLPPQASSPAGDAKDEDEELPLDFRAPADPVIEELGPLIVQLGEIQAESEIVPWSGSWLPARDPWLSEGRPAPLQIWDNWVQSYFGQAIGSAWSFEKASSAQAQHALAWEGACDAWAIASLYESEPQRPWLAPNGSIVSVGLQKAILVKSWERVEGKRIYGRPYRGDRESDWSEPSPMALHRFIQAELFEQGRPFIVDKDPGVPIWNTPVFAATFRLTQDETDPATIQVYAGLKGVDPLFGNPNEVGTHISWIELRYQLRGVPLGGGRFGVVDSQWVRDPELGVDSIEFHPDFLVGLPPRGQAVQHQSRNPALQEQVIEHFRKAAGLELRLP